MCRTLYTMHPSFIIYIYLKMPKDQIIQNASPSKVAVIVFVVIIILALIIIPILIAVETIFITKNLNLTLIPNLPCQLQHVVHTRTHQ